jgi:hypothetical protein
LDTDTHNILVRWRKHFSWLFNVHGVSDVEQRDIHKVEPLVPEPSTFEVEMAIEKLKGHKSSGIHQIPAELIKAGGRTICCAILSYLVTPWNRVLLEKLTVNFAASQEIPRIYGTRNFLTVPTSACHLSLS